MGPMRIREMPSELPLLPLYLPRRYMDYLVNYARGTQNEDGADCITVVYTHSRPKAQSLII